MTTMVKKGDQGDRADFGDEFRFVPRLPLELQHREPGDDAGQKGIPR